MKKIVRIVFPIILTTVLISCDIRQRFPVNYTYDDLASLQSALLNLEYTEYPEGYGYHVFFFDIDEAEVDSTYKFFGLNYGHEQQLSTQEHPLVHSQPWLSQQLIAPNYLVELEIIPRFVSFSEVDASSLAFTEKTDGYSSVYYQDVLLLRIKGNETAKYDFYTSYKDRISSVEVGANHDPEA